MLRFLFSFRGRISRAQMWIAFVGFFAARLAVGVLARTFEALSRLTLFPRDWGGWLYAAGQHEPGDYVAVATILFVLLYHAILIAIGLAFVTRRLHDRNKGAGWLVAFCLAPILLDLVQWWFFGARGYIMFGPSEMKSPVDMLLLFGMDSLILWAFVELLVLPGTTGSNRFGSDPLRKRG